MDRTLFKHFTNPFKKSWRVNDFFDIPFRQNERYCERISDLSINAKSNGKNTHNKEGKLHPYIKVSKISGSGATSDRPLTRGRRCYLRRVGQMAERSG